MGSEIIEGKDGLSVQAHILSQRVDGLVEGLKINLNSFHEWGPAKIPPGSPQPRPFLGIHFVNCGTYGRIYQNKEGSAYIGHCPKCMHP